MNARVSTIAPMWHIDGYVLFPNGWSSTGTIYLSPNADKRTIYHEYGHLKFQKYLLTDEARKFWESKEDPYHENMAITYAKWKLGEKVKKKYIDWFNERLVK